jgi:sRNA-binding protein
VTYTPIFSSILRSSILLEDVEARWLWTVILIMADETRGTQGVLDCPLERLAQIANLSVEQTRAAMARFCAPDPSSTGKDCDGRRLVPLEHTEGFDDRKWKLVNWQRYKAEERKVQVAAADRRHKAKVKLQKEIEAQAIKSNQKQSKSDPPSPSPSPSPSPTKEGLRDIASDVPEPPQQPKPAPKTRERFSPPTVEAVAAFIDEQIARGFRDYSKVNPRRFVAHYDSNGWKVGRNAMKNWKAAVATWAAKENE